MPRKKLTNTTSLPMPLARWFDSAPYVTRMRDIMEDEVMRTAIATLKNSAMPTATALSPDPQANSNKMAWLAGYTDAMTDLEKLTKRPKMKQTPDLADEWTH